MVTAGPSGSEGVLRLRSMPLVDQVATLFACCASTRWAAVVAERLDGCADEEALFALSEKVWWLLSPGDWREALDAHPKIGEWTAAGSQEGREQGAMASAGPALREAIAEGNRAYEERFGMTYVVRARGRNPAELLLLLRRRLNNDPVTELRVAAAEQAEITRLRLADMLAQAVAA
jgi:OHCU decarboxylase